MSAPVFRFSGHESFTCRYAWIPKAVEALGVDTLLFTDIDSAMVLLGLGKNMVQSLRFWVQAMRVAEPASNGGLQLTDFGKRVFGPSGLDPYLEDITTLWLLHWQLCSQDKNPLFAWDFLFNRYNEPEIIKSEVVSVIEREARQLARPLSKATLAQHFDVFMHTYVATRGQKAEILEDNLDCPLVELELIERVGQRANAKDKLEPAYAFRREPKPDLSAGVFLFAIDEYWNRCRPDEQTLSLRDVASGAGSPGQVFKLPEDDVRRRLSQIEEDSDGVLLYSETAMFDQLRRSEDWEFDNILTHAYEGDFARA
ncbi:MAG: DUF4007 family protein [Pirellulales bacterium]|nr:DUF4007 family protein [Pirellulales bacterium]